ncbi:MAG: AbrB/MazE/SpoVT family DNA-binding domain-containing protein [Rhizobiaceae bacterium]|nr:AbrB/MazE/SpoVT family DNA-binding domain-containing protein [Rhizobiaceae bacterium]
MRVTEKGQVTIPKAIRDKLGIQPGSEVAFIEVKNEVQLVNCDLPKTLEARRKELQQHLVAARGTIDTMGMNGKDYVDWLRGPRDDLDTD